jgi:hypothetical protein
LWHSRIPALAILATRRISVRLDDMTVIVTYPALSIGGRRMGPPVEAARYVHLAVGYLATVLIGVAVWYALEYLLFHQTRGLGSVGAMALVITVFYSIGLIITIDFSLSIRELPAQAKYEVSAALRTYLDGKRFPLIASTDRADDYGYRRLSRNLSVRGEFISIIRSKDEIVVFAPFYIIFKLYDFLNSANMSSLSHI